LRVRAHFVVVEWRRVRREERSFWRICRAGGVLLLERDWEREARAAEDDCEASVSAASAVFQRSAVGSNIIFAICARLSVCRRTSFDRRTQIISILGFRCGGDAIASRP
jgi:hypothetical protein